MHRDMLPSPEQPSDIAAHCTLRAGMEAVHILQVINLHLSTETYSGLLYRLIIQTLDTFHFLRVCSFFHEFWWETFIPHYHFPVKMSLSKFEDWNYKTLFFSFSANFFTINTILITTRCSLWNKLPGNYLSFQLHMSLLYKNGNVLQNPLQA